jgi:hypothetical protein
MSEALKGRSAWNKGKPGPPSPRRGKPSNISEAGKQRFREARQKQVGENNPFFGKKHSEETKKCLSESNRGKKLSADGVERLRLLHIGKKRSPESLARMSAAQKKNEAALTALKKRHEASRVPVADSAGRTYTSSREAAAALGVSTATICHALKDGRMVRGLTIKRLKD